MQHKPNLAVHRNADGLTYHIQCAPDGLFAPMALYASLTPYDPSPSFLCTIDQPELSIASPHPHRRVYFALGSGDVPMRWAADRAVEIASVENFRDLGGYPTRDGRTVKWGRFFRCGAVRGLSANERDALAALRVAHIFDYRAIDEAGNAPDTPGPDTQYHLVPAIRATDDAQELANMDMVQQLKTIHTSQDAARMFGLFTSLYTALPFANEAYRHMFSALDCESALPMIQHCSAGKDRTGVGCALLLTALGVARETVMADYLLSQAFRTEANRQFIGQFSKIGLSDAAMDLLARMMSVSEELLQQAFDAIAARYPHIEDFFAGEYGITQERLQCWRAMHTL